MTQRESLNQSLTDQVQTAGSKLRSLKKYRIGIYFCGSCTLLFIILACISAPILGKLIDSEARKGIVMTPETENLWAHIPGATETITIRNFTFFNFTNPREVLYRNAKPVFKQISGYKYQEYNDMENIRYVEDGNVVQFDYWLYFKESDSRNPNENLKILNLGPLGFWSQVQVAPDDNFALNGFGPLFVELRDTLKNIVLGQGVSGQYLPDYQSFLVLAQMAELSTQTTEFLWNDRLYGLNDTDHYQIWVESSMLGIGSNQSNHLQNYFCLSSTQMQTILIQIEEWSSSLDGIIGNWYCGSNECSSQTMVYKQLSHSGITKYPPPGSDSIDSICSGNITCIGYPEIDNYLQYVFKKDYPNREDCFGVVFDEEQFKRFFEPSKQSYCLLHAGNLNQLFTDGKYFDSTGNQQAFNNIKSRFQLDSNQKTFVFWNWVKYFTYQFVLKQSKNGTKGIAGIGGVASQALYEVIAGTSGWLLQTMLSAKVANKMKSKFDTCEMFLKSTVDELSQDQVVSICSTINIEKASTLIPLINTCRYLYSEMWQQTRKNNSLSNLQMNQLCDSEQTSLKTLIDQSQVDLEEKYSCTFTPEVGCSDFQIGYKQWNQSLITRNPIPELNYPPAWSINQWNADFPNFQYSYYLYFMESTSMYRPTLNEIVDLLSFDKLYNGQMIQQLWTMDSKKFKQWFYFSDKQLLKQYLRFIVLQVGFGGFTQQRPAKQLIFGYDDPFLKTLKDMDPILGGDPSTASWIALNDPNSTKQEAKLYPQAMYTGKNDSSLTRFYASINGKNTINYNYSYWNGDEVINSTMSPWAEEDHFVGTDAFQVPPGVKADDPNVNMSIFITTLYRYGNAAFKQHTSKEDMDLILAGMPNEIFQSQSSCPSNQKYYQIYGGFSNQTSVVGVPLFVSKNHFLDAPSNWSELVDIYDQEGKFKFKASEYDDTRILLEPTTGTSFSATIYLQSSYLFENDELFSRKDTMMLPIFTVWRSGNMSSNAVDEYFGDLRTGLKLKKKSTFFMIALGGFCMILTLIILAKCQKYSKQHTKPSSLMTVDIENE